VQGAGISPRIAQMFMAIANHPVLANTSTYSQLPPAYNTLYMLSRLEPAELEQALEDETVTPKMKVNDACQLANMAKHARARAENEREVTAAAEFAELLEHDAAVAHLLDRGHAASHKEAEQIVLAPSEASDEPTAFDEEGTPFVEWTFADFVEPPRGERPPDYDEMSPREKVRSTVVDIVLDLANLADFTCGSDDIWSTSWPSEIPEAERKEMADYLRADWTRAIARVEEILRILEAGGS